MKTTVSCLLENRLGSLDRILGTLTYRGIVPENFMATINTQSGWMEVQFTFSCDDAHAVDKLIKVLNKQVTILGTRHTSYADGEKKRILPFPTVQETTRSSTNVHHA